MSPCVINVLVSFCNNQPEHSLTPVRFAFPESGCADCWVLSCSLLNSVCSLNFGISPPAAAVLCPDLLTSPQRGLLNPRETIKL